MSLTWSIPAEAPQGASPGLMQSIGAALRRAWSTYLERRLHRLVATELYGMSDRELKDIGLSRSEIDAAVRGPDPQAPHYWRGRYY